MKKSSSTGLGLKKKVKNKRLFSCVFLGVGGENYKYTKVYDYWRKFRGQAKFAFLRQAFIKKVSSQAANGPWDLVKHS